MLSDVLREMPFEILEAANGARGLERARNEKPQAIFLDLNMPDGPDGFVVLERLKADPETRDIPVVVVTSQELTVEERQCLERHSLAILSKTFGGRATARHEIRGLLMAAGVVPDLASRAAVTDG